MPYLHAWHAAVIAWQQGTGSVDGEGSGSVYGERAGAGGRPAGERAGGKRSVGERAGGAEMGKSPTQGERAGAGGRPAGGRLIGSVAGGDAAALHRSQTAHKGIGRLPAVKLHSRRRARGSTLPKQGQI